MILEVTYYKEPSFPVWLRQTHRSPPCLLLTRPCNSHSLSYEWLAAFGPHWLIWTTYLLPWLDQTLVKLLPNPWTLNFDLKVIQQCSSSGPLPCSIWWWGYGDNSLLCLPWFWFFLALLLYKKNPFLSEPWDTCRSYSQECSPYYSSLLNSLSLFNFGSVYTAQ